MSSIVNELIFNGECATDVLNYVKSEEMDFDFNKILREPAHLDQHEVKPWRFSNWGCGTNAIAPQRIKNKITFNTKGGACFFALHELTRKFPGLFLRYSFSSNEKEDFTGTFAIKGGRCLEVVE